MECIQHEILLKLQYVKYQNFMYNLYTTKKSALSTTKKCEDVEDDVEDDGWSRAVRNILQRPTSKINCTSKLPRNNNTWNLEPRCRCWAIVYYWFRSGLNEQFDASIYLIDLHKYRHSFFIKQLRPTHEAAPT